MLPQNPQKRSRAQSHANNRRMDIPRNIRNSHAHIHMRQKPSINRSGMAQSTPWPHCPSSTTMHCRVPWIVLDPRLALASVTKFVCRPSKCIHQTVRTITGVNISTHTRSVLMISMAKKLTIVIKKLHIQTSAREKNHGSIMRPCATRDGRRE